MTYYLNPLTGRFPMTVADIKEANPNTSFAKDATVFDGYIMITDPVEPAYDKASQRLVLLPPGSWTIERGMRMVTTRNPITKAETTEEKMVDISSTWVPSADGTYAQTYRIDPMSAQEIANIAAEATALASTEYQRLRAAAYPSVVDQLDLLFHGGVEGWKAAIQAVKTMYPK